MLVPFLFSSYDLIEFHSLDIRYADVGIADGDNYYVLDGTNGAVLRNITVSDNSYSTSSSSFDFQNDGVPEFVYCSFLVSAYSESPTNRQPPHSILMAN